MKISVNSWHYRYIRKLGFSAPNNLCPYFWKLMFCLMVPLVFLVAVAFGLLILVAVGAWAFHHPTTVLIILALAVGLGALLFSIGWLVFSSTSRSAFSVVGQSKLVEGIADGAILTGQYITATHHKLCPRLEFVGEDQPRNLQVI